MDKIHADSVYDFYMGIHTDKKGFRYTLYNIVPKGSPAPSSGYTNMQYIEDVKHTRFPEGKGFVVWTSV